ncbi:mitochondrial carrier domain-containing protein [Mycena olivaceomarginata]|uniref:Mitochondrial carrier domain-containing protein n=1 Tax=Mycena albidolilacea TaxID=1033008 RepID=A0AAD6ZDU1_9AGAR|nr:mitochondrial carrier domain-containing protein [Mycena albidolilacea]KAJ7875541.1 mitochondrial carrier domain-containing protein [Mycena olivaceomarginata]
MASETKKPLPFVANFAAGAIAGISEILTFYPLDVVKTRMQLETGKAKHGLVGTFQSIVKEEGFGRLYRGLVPPLLLEAPKRAVKFAANDFWGKTYMDFTGQTKMTQNLSILTGCSAGATESFVVVPFELVKIKMQDKTSTFKGPMEVVRHIVKADGLLGLYAGMESTFWRHIWWNGGYFGCIFQVRTLLPKAETPQATLLNNFISGSIGGFAGTLLNTPFDVVKSRIQSVSRVPGVTPKYNWTYPALVTIFREEGAGALYKGFVPKVLRLAPGGGVLLLVVEFTLGVFRKALGPPYI